MRFDSNVLSRTATFILAGGEGKRLQPFTERRAKPLVPFGGVFRIIDFTLSNCINSSIRRAYLLTQYKANSLRHYVESAAWKMDLVCLPSACSNRYRGTADAVFQNVAHLRWQKADYVLILAADHIYKMDYRRLLRFHVGHGADVTIGTVQYPQCRARELGIVEVNQQAEVVGFEEKPEQPKGLPSDPSRVLASMGVYVFNASTLRTALAGDAGRGGSHEFGNDVIPNLIQSNRVIAYDFTTADEGLMNYWRDVGTIDSYHHTHMELPLLNTRFDPYTDARWPIYASGETVPLRKVFDQSRRTVDSIIWPNSKLSGSTIVQSVVSPQVEVAPSAEIHSSVLMAGVRVGRGARIRRAIVDEGVQIPDGASIGFDYAEDRRRFAVSENGVVVVHGSSVRKIEDQIEQFICLGGSK